VGIDEKFSRSEVKGQGHMCLHCLRVIMGEAYISMVWHPGLFVTYPFFLFVFLELVFCVFGIFLYRLMVVAYLLYQYQCSGLHEKAFPEVVCFVSSATFVSLIARSFIY